MTIAANDVQLRGVALMMVLGTGVDVVGRDRVKLRDVFVAANCAPLPLGPAIDVEASTRVTLNRILATGPIPAAGPAGIRVAGTPQQGRVRIGRVNLYYCEMGVLLEDNGIQAVRLSGSRLAFNQRGIVLAGTSRAVVAHNWVQDNPIAGIELDAMSSGNAIGRNVVAGSATDVSDAGQANCWRKNDYETGSVPPC